MPTIDIMRTTGNGRDRMTIVIRDGRKVLFKGAMTMENFARAIAGINEVPSTSAGARQLHNTEN